ncbi:hypothetical protein L916_18657 [Phytophthora nicotianae]|uniref:Uncharacterized protein n=1 Tax=Phytophthora nicotianae TaxID=4792 RepID=W2I133_PHYNI|nr:hypothetical protein L916_18657 [Phytophthora nicotianae]
MENGEEVDSNKKVESAEGGEIVESVEAPKNMESGHSVEGSERGENGESKVGKQASKRRVESVDSVKSAKNVENKDTVESVGSTEYLEGVDTMASSEGDFDGYKPRKRETTRMKYLQVFVGATEFSAVRTVSRKIRVPLANAIAKPDTVDGYHMRDRKAKQGAKLMFKRWGETLAMDFTHGTNSLGYHLDAKVVLCQFHAIAYWKMVMKRSTFRLTISQQEGLIELMTRLLYW